MAAQMRPRREALEHEGEITTADAREWLRQRPQGSVSPGDVQRHFAIGYNRARSLLEALARTGDLRRLPGSVPLWEPIRRSGGSLPAPKPETVPQETLRLRRENQALRDELRRQAVRDRDTREHARELYAAGWSNAWIAKALRITLPEAREMTR